MKNSLCFIPVILILCSIIFSGSTLKSWPSIFNRSSKVTTSIFLDQKTNQKIYTATYPLAECQGLVSIKSHTHWKDYPTLYPGKLYPKEHQAINLKLVRHAANEVVIKAVLDKEIYELVDKSYEGMKPWHALHNPQSSNEFYQRKNGPRWIPWSDNALTNNWLKLERNVQIRAHNRLELRLEEPGYFEIAVPFDADIETNAGSFYCNTTNAQLFPVHEQSIDKATGKVVYKNSYLLSKPKGLIKIESNLMQNKPIAVVITRHKSNTVIVARTTSSEHITAADKQPIIQSSTQYAALLRGTNRLYLSFEEPGVYSVAVPNDADIEVNQLEGDISYISDKPTWLTIRGTTVNQVGHNGNLIRPSPNNKLLKNVNEWEYYWGSKSDPLTRLVTQNGHITVLRRYL
ncbi:hypothetical protein H0X48_06555 [Candidatus Dependentiae bacterium]|nr:hypothetical protein [Candidatus Dependentiae bacterium]